MAITALEKIQAIQEKAQKEIDAIKDEARSELSKRIGEAREHLRSLEAEYAELTGRNVRGGRVKKASASGPKAEISSEKLEELLKGKDGPKMNRKALNTAGYSLKSAMNIAKGNQKKFGFQQKGPQGEIWLK